MSYWKQFENFDPLTDHVPYWPFAEAPGIASRARYMLRNRTSHDIRQIATVSNEMIGSYFDQAKQDEIGRLQREEDWDYLEMDEDRIVLGLNPDRAGDLDFPTPENTRELDALGECIGTRSEVLGQGVPDPQDYEYFAVMALWKVAGAIYRVKYKYDFKNDKHVKKDLNKLESHDFTSAGQSVIQAMEAICHAENRRDLRRLEDRFAERLAAAEKSISAKAQETNDAMWKAQQEDEVNKKSEYAKKLAALSKERRNESVAAVLARWDADAALQNLSISKAGKKLSKWLEGQVLFFAEPRTVSLWISAHKKSKISA